ncbi:MAG: serine/threonine-protein kinase [Gammaproteobacteria bacterium]|nr:serine/threonine-protein kinase [Gammaproteobacteria bacterium]
MGLGTTAFWRSNWLVALVYSGVFTLLAVFPFASALQNAESGVLTHAMKWSVQTPSNDIAIIAIDRKSLENVGDWPWQRNVFAQLIDQLATSGARSIATTIRLDSPQNELGLFYLTGLRERLASGGANSKILVEPMAYLDQALADLGTDSNLAESMARAGNVYLPMDFPRNGRPGDMAPYSPIQWLADSPAIQAPRAGYAQQALPLFTTAAAGSGHLYMPTDSDGIRRRFNLLVSSQGKLYPSLALLLTTGARGNNPINASVDEENRLHIGSLLVPADSTLATIVHWYPPRAGAQPFTVDSFWDVFAGNTPADKFRNKIVLLGPTEKSLARMLKTPVGASTPEIIALAHEISTLINQHFTARPAWVPGAEWAVWLLVAIYLAFVLPRLRPRFAILTSLGITAIMLVASMAIYVSENIWLKPLGPILMLLLGHMVLAVKSLDWERLLEKRQPNEQIESNRMLGLAFQAQGELELAWDKFRGLPLDDSMMAILYQLALGFEAKRKLNRAADIYDHMAAFDADYRDLQKRMRLAQQLEDTVTLGLPGASGRAPVRLSEDGPGQPQLGRYQVQEEIGKGAMGVVYLAYDPRLNRQVALKAIPLAEEFSENELEEVKLRFFREAEAAGRLDHPDIVGVYDVGEDNDLAYIAMEYVDGHRLSEFTSPAHLLAEETVLELTARTAEALHYAHSRGVVHRDIKPSNLLYNESIDQLKVADFGVARFDDSNRTRTGLVMGTPSYMSPEQIEGENVTGASDLFSLGVTLYQLLTGYLPFRADSLAKLMYKIANEPHLAVNLVRSDLPDCIEKLMSKALAKKPLDRFNSGAEMAKSIRDCLSRLREEKAHGSNSL